MIARNDHERFSSNRGVSHLNEARRIDELSIGSVWGMKFSLITSAQIVLYLLAKSCVLLVFCVVSMNWLTMAAAGVIRRRHLPDGGIQWLPVKPWTCYIGRCHPRHTAASAWQSWLAMSANVSVGYTPQMTDIFVCRRHVGNAVGVVSAVRPCRHTLLQVRRNWY